VSELIPLPDEPVAFEILDPALLQRDVRVPVRASEHPAAVYLASLSEGSRRAMAGALDTIAGLLTGYRYDMRTFPWGALRYSHTAAVRAQLADLYAPATANKMLAALRGVLREAWRLGLMTAEEHARASDIPPVRGSSPPRGRALVGGELASLFAACTRDKTPAGKRDAALLAVLYTCGLRRSEAVGLLLRDYSPTDGSLRVHAGKGGKSRLVYPTPEARGAIEAWLGARKLSDGPLFCPVNKGGKVTLRAMTDQSVRKILIKRAKEAGIEAFSPHDLRRTMIGDLLDAGADISTVQRLAGHATVTTTARYDRRGEDAKRKAAELLRLPLGAEDV
jgi:site-specific recombinase XerD